MDKHVGGTVWSESQRDPFDLRVVTALMVSSSARGFARSPSIWGFAKIPSGRKHMVMWKTLTSACSFRKNSHSPHGLEETGMAPGTQHNMGDEQDPMVWLGTEQHLPVKEAVASRCRTSA